MAKYVKEYTKKNAQLVSSYEFANAFTLEDVYVNPSEDKKRAYRDAIDTLVNKYGCALDSIRITAHTCQVFTIAGVNWNTTIPALIVITYANTYVTPLV